jgi:transcription elongation factor Elf1
MSGEENRDFVICGICLWSASLLRSSKGFTKCPMCGNESVEVIPVNDHEMYTLRMKEKGIEVEFDVERR